MKRLLASLVLIGGCILVSTQVKAPKCFAPDLGHWRRYFGFALAVNDDYLAVGDPEANRVVFYSKANGRWSRTGDILPPEGSAAAKVDEGFGFDLDLDGSLLVIGAYTETPSYSGGVYKVLLDSPTEVERIDTKEEGEISGFSVAADNGLIAFTIDRKTKSGTISRVRLLGSDIEEIPPPTDSAADAWGFDVALNKDLLVITAPHDEMGAAWLFNLQEPESPPQRLAVSNGYVHSAVAISDQFVAVSSVERSMLFSQGGRKTLIIEMTRILQSIFGEPWPTDFPPPHPKTLIMNIKDGTTTVLDGYGYLSLDRHILMRTYHGWHLDSPPSRLELFDLRDPAAPRLIARRWGRYSAQIHNGILATVKITSSGTKLCVQEGIR